MSVGAYIFGCRGPELTDAEFQFFRDVQPAGFILFSRNLNSPDGVARLTESFRNSVRRDVLIMVDQEGGRAERMGPPYWRSWIPPLDLCDRLSKPSAVKALRLRYGLIASELRSIGFNANCVPVADIARDCTHPVILNRCYARNPEDTAIFARSVANGCFDGGIVPVIKHIPGQGRAVADSHLELPVVDTPYEDLAAWDFIPFQELNDLALGMTSHVLYRSIDRDQPATLSKAVIEVIRNKIKFKGLLMTDDIAMSALVGGMGERCSASLAAGCDVILHCNGDMREMRDVVSESGTLANESLEKIESALSDRGAIPTDSIKDMEREYEELLGWAG